MAPCARSIDVEDVVQIVRQQELDVAIRSMYAAAPQRSEEDALTLDRSTFRDNALAPTQSMSTDATWIIRRISMPRGVGQADVGTACGGLLSENQQSRQACACSRHCHMYRHRADIIARI